MNFPNFRNKVGGRGSASPTEKKSTPDTTAKILLVKVLGMDGDKLITPLKYVKPDVIDSTDGVHYIPTFNCTIRVATEGRLRNDVKIPVVSIGFTKIESKEGEIVKNNTGFVLLSPVKEAVSQALKDADISDNYSLFLSIDDANTVEQFKCNCNDRANK